MHPRAVRRTLGARVNAAARAAGGQNGSARPSNSITPHSLGILEQIASACGRECPGRPARDRRLGQHRPRPAAPHRPPRPAFGRRATTTSSRPAGNGRACRAPEPSAEESAHPARSTSNGFSPEASCTRRGGRGAEELPVRALADDSRPNSATPNGASSHHLDALGLTPGRSNPCPPAPASPPAGATRRYPTRPIRRRDAELERTRPLGWSSQLQMVDDATTTACSRARSSSSDSTAVATARRSTSRAPRVRPQQRGVERGSLRRRAAAPTASWSTPRPADPQSAA